MIQLCTQENENNPYFHCQRFVIYHPHLDAHTAIFQSTNCIRTRIKRRRTHPAKHPHPTGRGCIDHRFNRWDSRDGHRDRSNRYSTALVSQKTEIKKQTRTPVCFYNEINPSSIPRRTASVRLEIPNFAYKDDK